MNKIEDFGVHASSYYSLDISYFKSDLDSLMLDLLWNKYWVNTLSSSPLLATRELATGQMQDIGQSDPIIARTARNGKGYGVTRLNQCDASNAAYIVAALLLCFKPIPNCTQGCTQCSVLEVVRLQLSNYNNPCSHVPQGQPLH